MAQRRPRQINRLIEPQTRRRRVQGEVFGYPGTPSSYLAEGPDRPERVPGDPAALERTRPKSRADRIRSPRSLKRRN